MGFPRIMYDIAPLVNPSFETGADGTSPPSGWATNASGGVGVAEVDDDMVLPFRRGSGHGLQAAKVSEAGGGTDIYIRQTALWRPPIGTKIALVGMMYMEGVPTLNQVQLRVVEMQGSTELDDTVLDRTPTEDEWDPFEVLRTIDQATADGIRAELMNKASSSVWFDYLHLGRRLDFPTMEADALDVSMATPRFLNIGGGAYESVRTGEPSSLIRLTIPRVTIDTGATSFDTELQQFLGFVRGYKRFAFWLDRDDSTNRGYHFSNCILRDVYDTRERAGARGYATALEFETPIEWVPQEAA